MVQVGVLRRGKYFKGKRMGKGNAVNEVPHSPICCGKPAPNVQYCAIVASALRGTLLPQAHPNAATHNDDTQRMQ